jgi:hypothetical protein
MLISDASISGYVSSAEKIISDIKQTAVEPYKNKFDWGEYWISVSSSIVGAFIFSILLVLLVFLAEEQIKSIIAPLVYEQQEEGTNNAIQPTVEPLRGSTPADG